MTRVRPAGVRVAHAAALALALLALALSLRESALFLPLAAVAGAALASPLLEWTSVPDALRRVLPRAHALVLLAAGLTAWLSRSMGILLLEPEAIPLVAAPVLVPVWAAFVLAPRAFPPGRTLVPAVVAVLTFAGLNPAPEGYGVSLLPFPRDGSRNGFAEVYLALVILVVGALWVAALKGSGPRWSRRTVVAVALTGALTTGLAASAIVGLPLAQPHVERAFAAALDQGATGLSGESTLGDIGALAVSRRRVLDLETSLPSGGQWRLPAEIFTRFDGRRWSNAAPPGSSAAPPTGGSGEPGPLRPVPAPVGVGSLVSGLGNWFAVRDAGGRRGAAAAGVEMRITQARTEEWPLLLPRDPVAVTGRTAHLNLDRFALVRRIPGLPLRQYGAVRGSPTSHHGRGPAELSPAEREENLSLPASVDPRVLSLASTLVPNSADAHEIVRATIHHLQTGYEYSLSPGPFRRDGDPLAEFLFEKKRGYCEYFASAAVVLLRLRDVPARYVKGLSVGPQSDMGGGLHVVRESDAHAWVEAWIPGEGWVEADPTPPGQFADARGAPVELQRWLEHARAALARAWARLVEGGPLSFLRWLGGEAASLVTRLVREPLVWIALAALVLGTAARRRLQLLWARRRRSRERRDDAALVPADLRALVRALERRWNTLGRPRLASRGLLEHATVVATPGSPEEPGLPGSLIEAGAEIVQAYYRARFGDGEAPSPDTLRRLRRSLSTRP